ncbi:hypothetical protein [Phocaeicola sp.]|uniref:hypothetical protein n=1 Tax=Phocaeicola sp. TaxID=2773926 RepID=UPI003AB4E8EF
MKRHKKEKRKNAVGRTLHTRLIRLNFPPQTIGSGQPAEHPKTQADALPNTCGRTG